jgi:hypothetical protein
LRQAGSFSKALRNQAAGSSLLCVAVASKLRIAAARLPARSEPVKSQFFLPRQIGLTAFSIG